MFSVCLIFIGAQLIVYPNGECSQHMVAAMLVADGKWEAVRERSLLPSVCMSYPGMSSSPIRPPRLLLVVLVVVV